MLKLMRHQTSFDKFMLMISVSIDCDTEQCAKPSKLYEELGCKAVYGSRSCCAKRFECPDFKKLDDNKCMFEGKEYKIGEILPRTDASNTKCVETCFCTRSVCISFSLKSFSTRYFLTPSYYKYNHSLSQTKQRTRQVYVQKQ